MLRRQSGTLSLTKSGNPTLKNCSFSAVLLIVCVGGGGGERERESEVEREKEREKTSGLSQRVRGGCFFPAYFVSCYGPCALKETWHRKEHIIIIIVIIMSVHFC